MSTVRVAAVDLGATSGRVMVGSVGPGELRLSQVSRFSNGPVSLPDGLHWDVLDLYRNAVAGLRAAGNDLVSVGIDAWAVDYGLLRGGRLLGTPYHYRDSGRTAGVAAVHRVVGQAELYQRNGLQFLPFNTVYQLAADPLLELAEGLLLIPDLFGYWLSGEVVAERTNASTTGLVDVSTGEWDRSLIDRLGLPGSVFGPLVDPGTPVGVVGELGVPLVAVGSHDTASAVVGVPLQGDDAAYISCGTWGLVGVELDKPVVTEESRAANFTNEGGVDGRVRFLTNVMGLWMLNECLRAWGASEELDSLLSAAASLPASSELIDVQDPVFLPAGDMPGRIASWFSDRGSPAPASRAAVVRVVIDSLAQAFASAVDVVADLTGRSIRVVHLVGGGSLNRFLCQTTADRSGRVVLAGPVEATAIGNVLVQARTAGALSGSLESLRQLVVDSAPPTRYSPSA